MATCTTHSLLLASSIMFQALWIIQPRMQSWHQGPHESKQVNPKFHPWDRISLPISCCVKKSSNTHPRASGYWGPIYTVINIMPLKPQEPRLCLRSNQGNFDLDVYSNDTSFHRASTHYAHLLSQKGSRAAQEKLHINISIFHSCISGPLPMKLAHH